jgi:uncharacterized protein (UPF0276 family)
VKPRVGIGYRREIGDWIRSRPAEVQCLEITAEHFFDNAEPLAELRREFPLFVHGLGLSLGTPGALDAKTMSSFVRVVQHARPEWVSDHIAFTRTAEVDLGHLNPVRPTEETLRVFSEHTRQLTDATGCKVLLENITTHLRLDGEMSETDFLNALCRRAGCGLLLDVTNLFINARNHRFDAVKWLRAIEPQNIVQLHIVGYSHGDQRLEDHHSAAIQPELIDLYVEVLKHAPVSAVILERDDKFEDLDGIRADLAKLEAAHAAV